MGTRVNPLECFAVPKKGLQDARKVYHGTPSRARPRGHRMLTTSTISGVLHCLQHASLPPSAPKNGLALPHDSRIKQAAVYAKLEFERNKLRDQLLHWKRDACPKYQLRHTCCATPAAPYLLRHTCCATPAAPYLLRHTCCATLAAPRLLRHTCDTCWATPAGRHLLGDT